MNDRITDAERGRHGEMSAWTCFSTDAREESFIVSARDVREAEMAARGHLQTADRVDCERATEHRRAYFRDPGHIRGYLNALGGSGDLWIMQIPRGPGAAPWWSVGLVEHPAGCRVVRVQPWHQVAPDRGWFRSDGLGLTANRLNALGQSLQNTNAVASELDLEAAFVDLPPSFRVRRDAQIDYDGTWF